MGSLLLPLSRLVALVSLGFRLLLWCGEVRKIVWSVMLLVLPDNYLFAHDGMYVECARDGMCRTAFMMSPRRAKLGATKIPT